MPQEFLPSPIASDAVQGLELALARVVAQVRAEFVMEKRVMAAELALARTEFAAMLERLAIAEQESKERRVELRGEPGPAGPAGSDGQSGVNGAAGEPGEPGRDGRDGLPGVPGERGRDGINGKDGLGFQSARQMEDSEHFSIEFLCGDEVVRKFTFKKPTLADLHCGPFKAGTKYRRGQAVTYGGSTFICLRGDTDLKPESDDWLLIVKRGLDGRNGKDGERGPVGAQGPAGRDLTQIAGDGRRYG